jgi:hypothetical protein
MASGPHLFRFNDLNDLGTQHSASFKFCTTCVPQTSGFLKRGVTAPRTDVHLNLKKATDRLRSPVGLIKPH